MGQASQKEEIGLLRLDTHATGGFPRTRLWFIMQGSMDAAENEKRLVAACADGDPGAWDRFVETYSPFLYATVRKLLRDAGGDPCDPAVEEAFSDVFYEIYRSDFRALRSFSGRSRLTTYLYVIARRACLGSLRFGAGETGPEALEEQAWDGPSPLSRAEEEDRDALLRARVQDLPVRDRNALQLFYFRGRSLAAIGEALGVSEAHAGVIVKRARDKLRRILQRNRESLL